MLVPKMTKFVGPWVLLLLPLLVGNHGRTDKICQVILVSILKVSTSSAAAKVLRSLYFLSSTSFFGSSLVAHAGKCHVYMGGPRNWLVTSQMAQVLGNEQRRRRRSLSHNLGVNALQFYIDVLERNLVTQGYDLTGELPQNDAAAGGSIFLSPKINWELMIIF